MGQGVVGIVVTTDTERANRQKDLSTYLLNAQSTFIRRYIE